MIEKSLLYRPCQVSILNYKNIVVEKLKDHEKSLNILDQGYNNNHNTNMVEHTNQNTKHSSVKVMQNEPEQCKCMFKK